MIPVFWNGCSTNWDSALPRYVLDNAEKCEHFDSLKKAAKYSKSDHAVICIPGQHSLNDYEKINHAASYFPFITFLIFGDEEALFDASRLDHPKAKTWWFAPPLFPRRNLDRVAVFGWPTQAREMLAEERTKIDHRDLDWSFLGQVTHDRRLECVAAAENLPGGYLLTSNGFSQGAPREEYYRILLRSKIALCPSGPCTPDSFRAAEAFEAHCIPILDGRTPDPNYPGGYWEYVFDTKFLPCPVIQDWEDLPVIVNHVLRDYTGFYFRCVQFWAEYKAKLISWMREDLRR